MRIDVELPQAHLRLELARLYRRMQSPGDALYGLRTLPIVKPPLLFRWRVADGEHYVYVEDPVRRCLAGVTVLNRLIELDRRADRWLRASHSKYAPEYQRRGIATAVYRWALESGLCLVSGARQSSGAHALWQSLAREHPLGWVDLGDRPLRFLGTSCAPESVDRLEVRMLLLGRGWCFDTLVERTGARRSMAQPQPQH